MSTLADSDGDDAATGASYLELARVLIDHGANTAADLRELWSRMVFNMLVSNADDHLRNHGFLLTPGKGWRLSPAYDMDPIPDAHGLELNVREANLRGLARSSSGHCAQRLVGAIISAAPEARSPTSSESNVEELFANETEAPRADV